MMQRHTFNRLQQKCMDASGAALLCGVLWKKGHSPLSPGCTQRTHNKHRRTNKNWEAQPAYIICFHNIPRRKKKKCKKTNGKVKRVARTAGHRGKKKDRGGGRLLLRNVNSTFINRTKNREKKCQVNVSDCMLTLCGLPHSIGNVLDPFFLILAALCNFSAPTRSPQWRYLTQFSLRTEYQKSWHRYYYGRLHTPHVATRELFDDASIVS